MKIIYKIKNFTDLRIVLDECGDIRFGGAIITPFQDMKMGKIVRNQPMPKWMVDALKNGKAIELIDFRVHKEVGKKPYVQIIGKVKNVDTSFENKKTPYLPYNNQDIIFYEYTEWTYEVYSVDGVEIHRELIDTQSIKKDFPEDIQKLYRKYKKISIETKKEARYEIISENNTISGKYNEKEDVFNFSVFRTKKWQDKEYLTYPYYDGKIRFGGNVPFTFNEKTAEIQLYHPLETSYEIRTNESGEYCPMKTEDILIDEFSSDTKDENIKIIKTGEKKKEKMYKSGVSNDGRRNDYDFEESLYYVFNVKYKDMYFKGLEVHVKTKTT